MNNQEKMIEGVYAAAGRQEPILYSKWFQIESVSVERYIWKLEPDGEKECIGRMNWWGDDEDCFSVEMPCGSGEKEFSSLIDAEDYVTLQEAQR